MPELPEAETIVRGLRAAVVGARIRRVDVVRPDILRQPRGTVVSLARGMTIHGVGRRGKNVLLLLDEGHVLAVNLGMTGRLLSFPSAPRGAARPTHPAVIVRFEGGSVLVFDDPRRFGTVEVLDAGGWALRDARMGPEPLDAGFTPARLHRGLQASRSPMRSWLLDQRRIAGVGNIYAAEALYLAGIHPARPAHGVTAAEARDLHRSIRSVLSAAIRQGGTTIRDYRNADGEEGAYGRQLLVYGRDGEPCSRCGTPIERTVFSNRSAFHCPLCQPPGPEE
jgi:formamidopyrimidine-DNA glycosylase